MALDIWQICQGDDHIAALNKIVHRLVESQQTTSTRKLVDSLHEQDILEELIESVKPAIMTEANSHHPLLYTAFRYPPLKYGSRFGYPFEQAIWYGSLTLDAAMAEKAYYQFNFLRASQGDFGLVEIPLTAFSVVVNTKHGINLEKSPFSPYTDIISSPVSYHISQQLGNCMRQVGVEAFSYQSARDPLGVNVGVFSIAAFQDKNPIASSMQTWRCLATKENVEFVKISIVESKIFNYPLAVFLVDGQLPFPAM